MSAATRTNRASRMLNHIQSNDHRLMRRVHRWKAPRWVRIITISATRLGDGWLWYALGLILVVLLVLLVLGGLPTWGHSRNWGYGPSGGLGLLLVIVLLLVILGRI